MAIKIARIRKKSERFQFVLDEKTKQRLYDASEHTGTAASEIVRQALKKELDTKYEK